MKKTITNPRRTLHKKHEHDWFQDIYREDVERCKNCMAWRVWKNN